MEHLKQESDEALVFAVKEIVKELVRRGTYETLAEAYSTFLTKTVLNEFKPD